MDQNEDDDDFKTVPSFFTRGKHGKSKPEGVQPQQKIDPDAFCPICQWSFGDVAESSRTSHLTACKGPGNLVKECSLGIKCCKPASKHYRDFSHQKLAVKRSLSQEQFKLLINNISSPRKKQKMCKDLKESGQMSMKSWVKSPEKPAAEIKREERDQGEHNTNCSFEFNMKNEVKHSCVEISVPNSKGSLSTKLYGSLELPVRSEVKNEQITSNNTRVEYGINQTLQCKIKRESASLCLEETKLTDSTGLPEKTEEVSDVNEFVECESTPKMKSEMREEDIFIDDDIFNGLEEFQGIEEPCSFSSAHNIASTSTENIKKDGADESTKESWKRIFHKGSNSFPSMSNGIITHQSTSKLTNDPNNAKKSYKQCPFYKKIPETTFVVDAFQYGVIPGVSHYFLSHFHSDHYGGLRKSFNKPIVCSRITATLVSKKLSVDRRYLRIVEVTEPFILGNATITPLDANHCPGSLMFIFQLLSGKCFLHVGDFRATAEMETYPAFRNINVDILFLDTTYCQPRYEFPKQEDVVSVAVQISLKYVREEPATLVVSGTYTIGKEKIFLGIADALNCKIWAPVGKREVLKSLNYKSLSSRLVEYPQLAQVHVLPMRSIFHEDLEEHLRVNSKVFKRILAFNPTGWNYSKNVELEEIPHITRGRVTVVGVPYSEHSSFNELRRFVKYLKPVKVIPTVQSRNISLASVSKLCAQWLAEGDKDNKEDSSKHQQKLTAFFSVKTK